MSDKLLTAREVAIKILYKIEKEDAYANLETAKVLNSVDLSENEKRLARELVYGTISQKMSLDYILSKLLKKPLESLPLWIILILRISLYQLIYLEKIPDSASVNEGVKLAKKYGHQGTASLVNAVLRNYLRKKEEIPLPGKEDGIEDYLTITLSHPRWLTKYLLKQWPAQDVETFYRFNNSRLGITVRTNTLKTTREQLIEMFQKEGIEAKEGIISPESVYLPHASGIFDTKIFSEGFFQVQDESSMLVAHILDPKPGKVVMDLCAAPGGKTTHIAELMKNNGTVYAFDIHEHKVSLIKENCLRLGITIVNTLAADSLMLSEEYNGLADYLLLDAPCSGLGVLGRRPDLRFRKNKDDIINMSRLSKKLLIKAADYLKSGGVLCFSTCTITKEENDETIDWFLNERPDFILSSFDHLLPFEANEEDNNAAKTGKLQLLPQKHGVEGFFISRLIKKENS